MVVIREGEMRNIASYLMIGACLLVAPVGMAFGANPGTQGQPSQSCQTFPSTATPGKAADNSGSAFNSIGKAPSVYAGAQPQNSVNPHSVAQYDVACFQQFQKLP